MSLSCAVCLSYLFFQAEDGIRDGHVTGVQTCALPISRILHLIGGDVLTAGDSLVLTAPAGPPDGTTAASTEHVPAAYRPVPTTPVTPEDLVIYLGRDEDYAYIAQIHPESTGVADWSDEVSRQIDDPQGTPANRRSHLRDVGWHLSPRDAGLATQADAIAHWHSTPRNCIR